MEFIVFRDRITKYIDEYMLIIEGSGKVKNFQTFKNHVETNKCTWVEDKDILRRNITETFNEVCFIHSLILNEECTLIYEPKVGISKKSIDLKCLCNDNIVYYDIKTVHPQNLNKWDYFQKAQDKEIIDGGMHLFKDSGGGEFWHHRVASRGKFIEHSKGFEDKIKELREKNSHYAMVFCGNDIDWHEDELEDFVEYYMTGHYSIWDHLATMSAHYCIAKKIEFSRFINKFAMVKRDELSKEYKVSPDVRLEEKLRTYRSHQE